MQIMLKKVVFCARKKKKLFLDLVTQKYLFITKQIQCHFLHGETIML